MLCSGVWCDLSASQKKDPLKKRLYHIERTHVLQRIVEFAHLAYFGRRHHLSFVVGHLALPVCRRHFDWLVRDAVRGIFVVVDEPCERVHAHEQAHYALFHPASVDVSTFRFSVGKSFYKTMEQMYAV